MINASTISPDYLDKAKVSGIDINKFILSHNFYPKQGSGLSEDNFIRINNSYERFNLPIQAFVAGDKLRRFPTYEGLPTIEIHREYNPYVATVEMIRKYKVNDVMIGDSLASKQSLDYIHKFLKEDVISIKAHLNENYKYLYNKKIKIRNDLGAWALRLVVDRNPNIEPNNNYDHTFGTITIDNKLYGRYSGEISIITKPVVNDAKINNIGFVQPNYLQLLNVIKGGDIIIFEKLD